jgi:uncharacterized protein (TIGR03437 family)
MVGQGEQTMNYLTKPAVAAITHFNRRTVLPAVLWALACTHPGLAQVAPPITLQVDVENFVVYTYDVTDPTKFATDPSRTASSLGLQQGGLKTFTPIIGIADIVAVNGMPTKGTWLTRGTVLNLQTSALPGQAIADTIRANMTEQVFEILQTNGTPIGTIMASEVGFGVAPPGAPLTSLGNNKAITGGTGAFLGVRGQMGFSQSAALRIASVSEDPANRRMNGGGTTRHLIQMFPMSRPEIVNANTGPAIFHADFSPVTAAKPAKTGEVLIVRASGLGPTRPGVDYGQPFPPDALQQVNSPIAVLVNGQQADVTSAIGWPGLVDTYRVDMRVPDGTTAGMATIKLIAAWITGPPVSIPIQ